MKVLVSGACGYIGSSLCQELLDHGHDVIAVDNLRYQNGRALLHLLGHPDFAFHKLDVRDTAYLRLARVADAIIPLAAIVGAPACDRHPGEALDVNQRSILTLVRYLSPTQKILFPNTNSGYGQKKEGFCTEEDPLNPISLYGVTKGEAEKAVLDHADSYSLRLATVFGASPRMRFDLMVNDFTRRLAQDGELEIFQGGFRRNFVHVRDVVRAFIWLLEDNGEPGIYNVGLPTANLTKLELAHSICDVLCRAPDCVTEGAGTDPDGRDYLVSSEKLLETGFHFRRRLEEGIAEVAQLCELFPAYELQKWSNLWSG